jgi:hypothetical protein
LEGATATTLSGWDSRICSVGAAVSETLNVLLFAIIISKNKHNNSIIVVTGRCSKSIIAAASTVHYIDSTFPGTVYSVDKSWYHGIIVIHTIIIFHSNDFGEGQQKLNVVEHPHRGSSRYCH